MNKKAFLAKANESSSFISESKVLSQLAILDKAVMISMDRLDFFSNHYMKLKDEIELLKKSRFYHVKLQESGQCLIEDCADRDINEVGIINMVQKKFQGYKGYCFIVNAGMQYLYVDGKMEESIQSCLQKTKSMQKQLEVLKPVSKIKEVFAHFKVECDYTYDYYKLCFDKSSKKIKREILEQDLRNYLMKYLKKNMQGDVMVEFCTDYVNDEESVDIYVNDGNQRAIIEVKFSLAKKYYEGVTNYGIADRVAKGVEQLNKYAIHLSKDARLVDYGYVYMFYISDLKKKTIIERIEKKLEAVMKNVSNDLVSIYSGYVLNDMKLWGTKV